MIEPKSIEIQNITKKRFPIYIRMPLIFLGILCFSITGYFTFINHTVEVFFAHLGGLSILALTGCWMGTMAKNRDHKYLRGFLIGFLIPIIVGFISVFLRFYLGDDGGSIICGGSASLGVALLIPVLFNVVIAELVASYNTMLNLLFSI